MYKTERNAFGLLKQSIDHDAILKSDIEQAFQAILTKYATKIYENRFLVGGVAEVILVSALRAAGIDAKDVAAQDARYDIEIPQGRLSVKGCFSKGASNIRLINVLGASTRSEWDIGTLFVISEKGIGYADPELMPNLTKRVSDAVTLNVRDLNLFLSDHPQYLIECEIPYALTDEAKSELVSRTIARDILKATARLKNFIGTAYQDPAS